MSLINTLGLGVKWVGRGILITLNNLYCIPTYVVWCVLLQPLLYLSPPLYWAIEGQLFYWLLTMVAFWSHSAHYRIVETGDPIDPIVSDHTLLLVNHQSTSDVPLLMAAFSTRPTLLQHLNWIMDAVFKYTNFGIVSVLHGDFFIYAGRDKREKSIVELVSYLHEIYIPRDRKWIVLFPEGGFLRKRRDTSNKYARKLGLPELNHVTLPRMGAIQAIVDTLGPPSSNHRMEEGKKSELKWLVDVTIAYPKGEPLDLVAVVTGCVPPCNVHFHYRLFPIQQVPREKKELQTWLYARYLEKESMLAQYYETGVWDGRVPPPSHLNSLVEEESRVNGADLLLTPPQSEREEEEEEVHSSRTVEQDLFRILIIHLFFLLSTLIHLLMGRNLFTRLSSLIPLF